MKDTFEEKDNRITFRFDEDDLKYKGDEVEILHALLGENDVYPVGEAYIQMDGTCPSMWYSMYSGLVFIIDLVHDCARLKRGETVTIEGREPTDEEMELIRAEDWYLEWIED